MLAALSAGGGGSGMVLEVNALRNSPTGRAAAAVPGRARGTGKRPRGAAADGHRPAARRRPGGHHRARPRGLRRLPARELGGPARDRRPARPTATAGRSPPSTRAATAAARCSPPAGETRSSTSATRRRTADASSTPSRAADRRRGRCSRPSRATASCTAWSPGPDLARTLGGTEAWATALVEAASKVELHLDARRDVALVADVSGRGRAEARGPGEDARRCAGAGPGPGARAEGDDDAAELLGFARVSPAHGNALSLEVALPLEVVARRLAFCRGEADAEDTEGGHGPAVALSSRRRRRGS